MPNQPDRIDFSITNKTLVFGLVLTVLVIVAVLLVSIYFDLIFEFRDYATLFTCGIICTTLFYTAKNMRLTYEFHVQKLSVDLDEKKLKKIELTIQISSEWFKSLSDHVEVSRAFIKKFTLNPEGTIDVIAFVKSIEDNPNERKSLVVILNYFEYLSLLLKRDLVDEQTLKDAFKTVFCEYFLRLKPFIDERQKASRRYLLNYEEVASKWSKG